MMKYRIPFYNSLQQDKNLAIVFYFDQLISLAKDSELTYKKSPIYRINKLGFQFGFWRDLLKNNPDFIIIELDAWILSNWVVLFLGQLLSFKVIGWGIGAGKGRFGNRLRTWMIRLSHRSILYHQKNVNYFLGRSPTLSNKLSVLNNTVYAKKLSFVFSKRKYFLVLGSLVKRKKIDLLIEAMALLQQSGMHPHLLIVGNGPEKERLIRLVEERQLSDSVVFKEATFREDLLDKYYASAIALVHPGQAGLGVLSAFARGVCVICKEDAISGGEKANIQHSKNGFFFQAGAKDLSQYLKKIMLDDTLLRQLSDNAYQHYWNNCTMDIMVNNFKNTLE